MVSLIIASILLALFFDFLNGMNDAANSIATIVSTRVMSPRAAVLWAAFWNFSAYFIFGVSVANTIGKGIIETNIVSEYLIFSALLGAVLWVYLCTHFGLPISVSHSLIGGMIGPAFFAYGFSSLILSGILKIALFIILSPMIGVILGFIIMNITLLLFKKKNPLKVEKGFRAMQLLSSAVFSLGHGANDAQKTMGIIAILLYSVSGTNDFISSYLFDYEKGFHVPGWLIATCYSVIALGTITGGWRVIKTLGDGLSKLKPIHGFCAETSGALTLIGTALLGIPVSTTHTITGSIIGVGLIRGSSSVRWITAKKIVWAWILTIPCTMVVSGLIYYLIGKFHV